MERGRDRGRYPSPGYATGLRFTTPGKQKRATQTVIEQAELLSTEWATAAA